MRRAAVLVLIGWLAAAAPAAGQISILGLKNSLVQFALEQISVPGEFEIAAEGVEEPEDGVTSLVGVTIADADGVWLRVAEARLNWTPTRLLRGELELAFLSAQDVEVLRRPGTPPAGEDAAAEDDGDPFAWPRSPIALHIEDMRLERVTIAPGVIAEQGLAFSARGAARDEGDVQSAELSLTRDDAVSARIRLEYRRTFDDAPRLKLFLDAVEGPGGIVAEAAGLPPDAASRVRVSADGPLTDWQMTLDAEAEGVLRATGLARLDATARLDAEAALTVTPGEALDPRLREVLSPRAKLDFAAREGEDGVVTIERGSIVSPFLTLSAEGTHDRESTETDIALQLEAQGELSRLAPGLSFDLAGFEGRASGPLDALTAEGALRVEGLDAGVAAATLATLDGRVGLTEAGVTAALDGAVQGLRLDRLGPDLLGPATLRAEGAFEDGVARLEVLRVASTPLTLSLSGEAAPAQGEADLTFTAEAPRLGPLARAYDVPASAALRWEGRASGPFDALALVGTANLTGLAWDGEALGDVEASHDLTVGPAPGGRLALRALGPAFGEATAALDGRLDGEVARLTTLEVDALGARLTGSGDVDLAAPGAEGVFELSAPDLATLSALTDRLDLPPLSGAVEARIEARREAGRQDATAELSLTGVEALGGRAASAEATARLRDVLGAPHGELRLDAREAGYDGYVVGQLGLAASAPAPAAEGGPLDVDLRVALQDIALKDAGGIGAVVAEASARDALGEPSVEITAGLSRLAAAGAATVGRIDLTASAAGLRGETPSGEVEATLTGVSAGGAAIPSAELAASLSEAGRLQAQASAPEAAGDGLSLRDARLTVEAEEALSDAREIDAALSVARLDAGPARRLSLQASLAGTLDALTLGVEGAGRLRLPEQEPQRLRLSLEAQADVAGDGGPRGQVARLVASAGPLRARLAEPLRFAPVEGGVGLQGLDLRFPGGRVQGEAGVLTGGFSADLRAVLSDPRSLHEALEPLGAGLPLSTGRITATVQADTRPAFARGALSLRARDLRLDGAESDPGALSVDADGAWDGRRLRVDARADGEFGQPLTVVAGLPVAAQPGGVPALNADGALDGSVSWQGRIERLWDYVPAADHLLTGDARIALDLGGTPASPRLGGDVALSDGRYQFLETGTILTDLTARSSLQPNGAFAVDATALDGAEGRVEARVALAPGGVLDARVTADDAVLVRREDVVARLSADIAAQGDGDALAVTGRVDLGRVEVRLVEALPPAIADLGDVRFKGEPEPEPEASAGGDVTLDLTISAPGGIFVRGRGLDSEWEAALTVDGTAAAPRVIGAVERVRGRLDFLGRDFVLVTGRIGFSGEQPIDPSLDVSLEHERDGFTGKIQAKGTASAPEIGFASTPAVPEGEVLPRTIFGEDSQSLSPVDALLLANAVRTLLSGGEGVTGDVRSAVGLDVLRIDESDAGGAQVTAGRNVADGVYVGVNQPLGGEAASVEVEVEVFDLDELGVGVVGAETGSDSGSTLGAGWRIDF